MNEKKRVLVLAADYPRPDGKVILLYVHMRNRYYLSHGIDVTVINFKAKARYELDGIPVLTLKDYQADHSSKFDVVICHAPNIRNHYLFLKRYQKRFDRLIFVFHGHEVVRLSSYPKPYGFLKQSSALMRNSREIYDRFKLRVWHGYLPKLAPKATFIFVSKWIQSEFYRWTGINPHSLEDHCVVINNSVGKVFEELNYDPAEDKEYDFITIRSWLDGSKYAVDVVNALANSNPTLTFLLVGKGEFFKHVPKAKNLTWIEGTVSHEKMLALLNRSRCGLMPTRHDTQGLMTCEFATFGLPVITSDIPVCHEILDGLDNVALISNEDTSVNLTPILNELTASVPYKKNRRYFAENTVMKEIELIQNGSSPSTETRS